MDKYDEKLKKIFVIWSKQRKVPEIWKNYSNDTVKIKNAM